MEITFTILFLLSGLVGTVYFFMAIIALFKRNGKAKKHWIKTGSFTILIPMICALVIGLTADSPTELATSEEKATDKKEEIDPATLQQTREKAFALLAARLIENPVFKEQSGYFIKMSGNAYSYSSAMSIKAFDEQYDAKSEKIFKRKDLVNALEKYGYEEITEAEYYMFPRLTGDATEFGSRAVDGLGFDIYIKGHWKDGFFINDKDHYYMLEFNSLQKQDNDMLEHLIDGAVGSSTGRKAMKWYKEMQETLYNPMYYYGYNDTFASVSTGYFSKEIGDYTFVMSADFDETAETFEEAFDYTLDIYDESYTDFLKDSAKGMQDFYGEVEFSKENEELLLKSATDLVAGTSPEAKEQAEILAATQSEPVTTEPIKMLEDTSSSDEDKGYAEILAGDKIDQYLYTYANLEIDYLYDSVDILSDFYDAQEAYMQSLMDRGISLQLNNYDIAFITHLSNGDMQATVNESFTIFNPSSGEKTITQTSVYTLTQVDGQYYITNLEVQ